MASDPNDPELAWYVSEFGGGLGILDPAGLAANQISEYEHWEVVSRSEK